MNVESGSWDVIHGSIGRYWGNGVAMGWLAGGEGFGAMMDAIIPSLEYPRGPSIGG